MFPIQKTIPENERLFSNRALVSLIVPLVAEQFLVISLGLVDTFMVSSISEAAVSAVSLVDSINILFTQLFSAMGAGGAVVAAQYLGKREPLNACKAAKQLLYLSMLMAFFFLIICFIFCDQILHLFFGSLSGDTLRHCRTFLLLSAMSYPALALYNGGAALLRVMSNSKSSMLIALMMNLINLAGNCLFIFGFKMEVAGSGLSTFLSRMAGAVLVILLLLHSNGDIRLLRPFRMEPDKAMIRRIFSLGVPGGLENSMFQIGKLMVTRIVASYSVVIIAANAVSGTITALFNLPGSAIGLSMITVVGQCIGAKNTAQAQFYAKKLLKIAYVVLGLADLVLFFMARPLAALFHLSPEGVDTAAHVLRIFAVVAAVFWPASFTLPNALRAAGDARFTMVVAVLSMWIFRIAFSYLLAYTFQMGLLGVWVAMFIDWVARSACFLFRYHSGKWLHKSVV